MMNRLNKLDYEDFLNSIIKNNKLNNIFILAEVPCMQKTSAHDRFLN